MKPMNTICIRSGNTRMIAHRGVSKLEAQNTASAFVAAGNRSYFGIETDVYHTRDGQYVLLRMPSGEVRRVLANCLATVGVVGNGDWEGVKLGKAGRKRLMGIRPTVRGVAMNPVDHPMGGGEGRTSGGSHPRSPWGQLAKGGKTRAKRKASDKIIVKRRK